jgi:Ca-activated chloride channel family protein
MNAPHINSEDPRLTAYALDEMEPAERAEFEQSMAGDAEAQQAVAEIRATARSLEAALAEEPVAVVVTPAVEPAEPKLNRDFDRKIVRFPYWLVGTAAAACFALVFTYTQIEQANQPLVIQSVAQKEQKSDASPAPAAAPTGETRLIEVQLAPMDKNAPIEAKEHAVADSSAAVASGAVDTMQASTALALPQPAAGPVFSHVGKYFSPPALDSAQGGASGSFGDERIKLEAFTVTGSLREQVASAEKNIRTERQAPPHTLGVRQEAEARTRHYGMQSGDFFRPDSRQNFNTEAYARVKDNDFLRVRGNELSTFSIDVDTAAYANVRRFLAGGQRPPPDAVRIEEMVNYFTYNYPAPGMDEGGAEAPRSAPFAASLEVASAPWQPEHRLVRIGLKGREVSDAARPAANLVFLIDVSGSMQPENKLPLVRKSLRLLVDKLRRDDRVAIAVYAGASGLALPSTPVARKSEILAAIDRMEAGGSTNGAAGIQLAYDVAKANFITGGVNRVILATDGDFNVGTTNEGELTRLIEEKAKSGVFLSVLGFGMGNYKDATLEKLADKGNGNYAYIDTEREARKALVEQAGGTLVTIAKDVKIQVEFNPDAVQAYRLIGYENRVLAKEDFNNDKVDAGEIGAGHTVTALYEVVPTGVAMPEVAPNVDALKYQKTENRIQNPESRIRKSGAEMLTVKIRYKEPAGDVSTKLEFPLVDGGHRFDAASPDFKFAAAVASFGMILRESPHKGATSLPQVAEWAREGVGSDAGGHRSEFLGLVEQARAVVGEE